MFERETINTEQDTAGATATLRLSAHYRQNKRTPQNAFEFFSSQGTTEIDAPGKQRITATFTPFVLTGKTKGLWKMCKIRRSSETLCECSNI